MDDEKFEEFLREQSHSKFVHQRPKLTDLARKFSSVVRPNLCEQLLFCHELLSKGNQKEKKKTTTKTTIRLTSEEKRLFDEEELLSAFQSIIANASGLHRHSSSSVKMRSETKEVSYPIHRFCRQGLYPNTSINRQEFNDDFVPWSMPFLQYNPSFYTKTLSLSTTDADPDTITSEMMWNQFDTNYNVDRRTANPFGHYLIDQNGYPLNPLGRTGLAGRGQLPRWGVNYQIHFVIMMGTNEIYQGNEIFQYLIEKCLDDDSYRLLSTWTTGTHMDAIKKTLKTYLMNIYRLWNKKDETNGNELDGIIDHLTFVSTAYIDDARNTDNAWLETSVLCYIQTDLQRSISSNSQIDLKRYFPLRSTTNQTNYSWQRLDHRSSLLDSERDVVRLIAQRYKAYW